MAKTLLEHHDGFLPISAVIDSSGELSYVAVDFGGEHCGAQEYFDLLVTELRTMVIENDNFAAVGLCVDMVWTADEGAKCDALKFLLEDRWNHAQTLLTLYKKEFDGGFSLGELVALDETERPEVFSQIDFSVEDRI
jgi:hypothetical protein